MLSKPLEINFSRSASRKEEEEKIEFKIISNSPSSLDQTVIINPIDHHQLDQNSSEAVKLAYEVFCNRESQLQASEGSKSASSGRCNPNIQAQASHKYDQKPLDTNNEPLDTNPPLDVNVEKSASNSISRDALAIQNKETESIISNLESSHQEIIQLDNSNSPESETNSFVQRNVTIRDVKNIKKMTRFKPSLKKVASEQ